MYERDIRVAPGSTVGLARAEMAHWRDCATTALARGEPLWCGVYTSIPGQLQRRLSEALQGCTTEQEIRIAFASVQDQQLHGSSLIYLDAGSHENVKELDQFRTIF
jgi:hypothetical protein